MAQNFVESATQIATADGDSVSAAFQINKDSMYIGIYMSAMADNAVVTLTMCPTSGGTYAPVLDPLDGADLVLGASGEHPWFIDISNYIMSIPSTYFFKLAFGASQSTGSDGATATLLEKA